MDKGTGRLTASLKPAVFGRPFAGWVSQVTPFPFPGWSTLTALSKQINKQKPLLTVKNHVCGTCVMKNRRLKHSISFHSSRMETLSSAGTLAEVDHINPNSTNASWAWMLPSIFSAPGKLRWKGYSQLEVRLCCIVKFYHNKNNSNNLKEQKSYNVH